MKEPIDVQALAREVAGSNFEDERLNKRLKALVAGMAADPSESLPRLFDSAGLEAAYRFFSNHRVTPDEILASHVEATRKRCEEAGDFLVVHDSTMFTYAYDAKREGLGRAWVSGAKTKKAFFAHVSLAIAGDGTRRPLGVAAFKTWVRGPLRSGVECERWEEQIRSASIRLRAQKNAIHVMDREADDYRMFHALIRDEHRFIARSQFDRRLDDPSGEAKLHAHLAGVSATIEREVQLTRRKTPSNPKSAAVHRARGARVAKLSIAAATVTLKRPQNLRTRETPTSLTLNIVRVWEPEPPADEPAVSWFLYTTEPIETPEQQLAIVDRYRARWTIEEYFKAIKTGCDFEKRQLQDYEGLVNLLATFAPIAYRILLIRSEARRVPHAKALTVVSPDQLDVLRARGRIKLGADPTAREVYLAIAALGGHIKYNGDPGWLTLAKGYERLETLTEGWVAAKLQLRSDQ
jgi:Transposase DNA-binding/Transposase DDE domain